MLSFATCSIFKYQAINFAFCSNWTATNIYCSLASLSSPSISLSSWVSFSLSFCSRAMACTSWIPSSISFISALWSFWRPVVYISWKDFEKEWVSKFSSPYRWDKYYKKVNAFISFQKYNSWKLNTKNFLSYIWFDFLQHERRKHQYLSEDNCRRRSTSRAFRLLFAEK